MTEAASTAPGPGARLLRRPAPVPARPTTTVWQQNADMASYRPETYAAQERHASTREAAREIATGHPVLAAYRMARSVERQARILGIHGVMLMPLCPCGGRCEHEQVAR